MAAVPGHSSLSSLAALVELHYRNSPLLSFATNRENMVAVLGHPQRGYPFDPSHHPAKKPVQVRAGQ